jgi:iron complex outermembrane receptor protein
VLGLQLQLVAAQSMSFDVPAQPLAQALSQFARQAGLQLTYSSELVQGRQARALTGSHDVRQGLAALLEGSGLQGRIEGGTLTLAPAAANAPENAHRLSEITVTTLPTAAWLMPKSEASASSSGWA